MITAHSLKKANKAIEEAQGIVAVEMPNGYFVFDGADNEKIYFSVVCKMSQTNQDEITDIKQKTRFEVISENDKGVYRAEFSMNHTLIMNGREMY